MPGLAFLVVAGNGAGEGLGFALSGSWPQARHSPLKSGAPARSLVTTRPSLHPRAGVRECRAHYASATRSGVADAVAGLGPVRRTKTTRSTAVRSGPGSRGRSLPVYGHHLPSLRSRRTTAADGVRFFGNATQGGPLGSQRRGQRRPATRAGGATCPQTVTTSTGQSGDGGRTLTTITPETPAIAAAHRTRPPPRATIDVVCSLSRALAHNQTRPACIAGMEDPATPGRRRWRAEGAKTSQSSVATDRGGQRRRRGPYWAHPRCAAAPRSDGLRPLRPESPVTRPGS